MSHQSHTSGYGTSDWLLGAVKSNPEGLLLLAAGCALLMRSGGSSGRTNQASRRPASTGYGDGRHYTGEGDGRRQSRGSGISESMSQAADSAREYASGVGRTVSETASTYASAVGDYAGEARRTIIDQSERLVEQARTTAQGTISRVLQEQPLAVAVVGLAAGAAVAAAIPATAVERRTLGPAGERLSEAAASVGQNLSQAASKAGEKLMNVAEERGLNADGLKDVASDVADAFGSAFKGEQTSRGGQSSGSGGGSSAQSSPGAMPQPGGTSGSSSSFGQGAGQAGKSPKPGTTKPPY